MEKKKNPNAWIWWTLAIAFVLAVIYYVYKYTNLPKVLSDKLGNNPTYNAGGGLLTDYGDEINTDMVLKFGDKSNNVTRLQSAINEMIDKYGYNYTKLSVDGVFGAKTLAAVKYISNNTLNSGTVTVNKIYNLPKLPTVGALNPAPAGGSLSAVTTTTGGKAYNPNLFSTYKN
jgi:hypothetical protein